jgi:hypothetical protein
MDYEQRKSATVECVDKIRSYFKDKGLKVSVLPVYYKRMHNTNLVIVSIKTPESMTDSYEKRQLLTREYAQQLRPLQEEYKDSTWISVD